VVHEARGGELAFRAVDRGNPGELASDEGLRRADGLWRADQKQPDFEALGAWVIDVYLNARVAGKTDAEAKQMIKDAIQGSDEWRRVHAPKP